MRRALAILMLAALGAAVASAQKRPLAAVPVIPLPAPVIPTNHIVITNRPARVAAVTNVVLAWQYTDAWYVVEASTNLITWYWKTNVPIQATNVTIPVGGPLEFYRMKTVLDTNLL